MLATHVLYNAFVVGGSVSGGGWFEPTLEWSRLNYNTIKLSWNVGDLVEHKVNLITVRAKPEGGPGRTEKITVSVDTAQVVFGGLELDTLYVVDVEAYQNRLVLADYQTFVHTWPTGKSDPYFINCISSHAFRST